MFAVILWQLTEHKWVGVMVIVTAALAGFGLYIAHRTGTNFRWFGVGVFLAIVVYGAILSTLRTYAEVKLQPVAVVVPHRRSRRRWACGLLHHRHVRQRPDRLRRPLRAQQRASPGRDAALQAWPAWLEFPRPAVEAISIGQRATLEEAEEQAPQLLSELYARLGRTSTAPASEHRCAREGIVCVLSPANDD